MKAYKIVNPENKFYNQILEYVSCSDLDNWGAVILRTDNKGGSRVFREGDFKIVDTKEEEKKENMKKKVIAKLEKWGNNSEEVKRMVFCHFDYAYKHYNGVSKIADCIVYIS